MEKINHWIINRDKSIATHESGLQLQFQEAEYGLIDGFPINQEIWLHSFPSDEREAIRSLFPALMCQGTEAYCRSLNCRH